MPERRTARRHRPHIGGRVRLRVVAEAKAYPDGVSYLQRPPRGGVRAVCRGTRFERRMRVLVASPACPAHFGGRRTRNRRSAGHGPGRPCRWCACGCTTASGAPTPICAPWTWLGVTPHLGKPRLAPRGMEPDSPIPPAAAGSLPANSPSRKGVERRFEALEDPLPDHLAVGLCPASPAKAGPGPFRLAVWPSRMGLMDRERPQARLGWPCTSRPSPCRTRHPEGWVAPGNGRKRQRVTAATVHSLQTQ